MSHDPIFDRSPFLAIGFTEIPRYDFGSATAESRSGIDPEAEMPRRFRSLVPENFLMMRHAPSELNVLNDLLRKGGPLPEAAEKLRAIADNHARLVIGADEFVKASAEWIAEHLKVKITVAHCSPFVRAKESASIFGTHSGLIDRWRVDSRIGERSYGEFGALPLTEKLKQWAARRSNPRHWTPPNGESIENTELEARDYIASIASKYSNGTVFAVTHGEFMVATRCIIEYPSEKQLLEFFTDAPPNCGIIHYTRRNPHTGEIAPYYTWMRLIDPNNQNPNWDGKWREIIRPTYTNEDLMAEVELHPRFLDFSTRKKS